MLPPQPCLLCGAMSREGVWCGPRDAALPYLGPAHCPVCALPTPDGEVCGRCLSHPQRFDRTVAVFAYAFPVDALIRALKFNEQLLLVPQLAGRLAQRIEVRPDCIVPMPLHPARLRERGFSQSLELARALRQARAREVSAWVIRALCRTNEPKNLDSSTKNTKVTKYGRRLRTSGNSSSEPGCATDGLFDFVRVVRDFRGQLRFLGWL